jgi:SWI/SNF-related matrix-associated actin-dependent regulator of chromatin subfamily A3
VLTHASIVFSTWRLTLDVIRIGLDRESISYVRYDGKVPHKDRQSVLDRFKTDTTIRVMLLTLSCGAVGYVVTLASPAVLPRTRHKLTLDQPHSNHSLPSLPHGATLVRIFQS